MRRYLLLIVLAIAVVSCKKSEVSALVFYESVQSLVFDVEGETKSVTFKTTMNWNAEVSDEWIEVDPMSGPAGENLNINITVAKNDSSTARNGYVRIVLSNGKDEKVELKQNGQAIEVDTSTIPNDEIWYTNGSTTEATEPYNTDVFGAEIISNTYDAKNECWVIKFDGDVTEVGFCAFRECEDVMSVTLPNNVERIGKGAFLDCSNLINITIPDVDVIESEAFTGCYNLSKFNSELASEDGRCMIVDNVLCAFAPADLTEYSIPFGITTIGDCSFKYCDKLSNVDIPNSVVQVGNYAFNKCMSLLSVNIPDSTIVIGY